MERFKTPSAAIVLVARTNGGRRQFLLQKRQNTGFGDGMWDLSCSGHVEENESMTAAASRECGEELGITVKSENLQFFTFVHKRDKSCGVVYYNAYFILTEYGGEPKIMESRKCAELRWFFEDRLPAELLDDRKRALTALKSGERYIEYGWD